MKLINVDGFSNTEGPDVDHFVVTFGLDDFRR